MTTKASNSVERLPAAQFDPAQYRRGKKYSLELELGVRASGATLPVVLWRGARPGRTLGITAGVHGDEFEGIRALLELESELDPAQMNGDVLAVPVANPPAFWSATRLSPLDEVNLARAFPGDAQGSPSYVIAYYLAHAIIRHADFYLDLHSAGVKLQMPRMVGYDATDPRSQEAAFLFGAPVVWGHPTTPPGRTISFASSQNIPWLYTEAAGAGRIDPEDLRVFRQGILRLMRHLGILSGSISPVPVEVQLYGDGNLEQSMQATQPGFLLTAVHMLQNVAAGQELGRTVTLHGNPVEIFRAPAAGVVALIHAFPRVESGELMFLITESVHSFPKERSHAHELEPS
jgi:predicted deacylase